jgi:hypothetical protein
MPRIAIKTNGPQFKGPVVYKATDPRSNVTPPEIFNPEILLAVYISFNTTLAIQV